MENIRIRVGKKFGSGKEKIGSGINIPDPHNCLEEFKKNCALTCLSSVMAAHTLSSTRRSMSGLE
jgi:hypothetical protein